MATRPKPIRQSVEELGAQDIVHVLAIKQLKEEMDSYNQILQRLVSQFNGAESRFESVEKAIAGLRELIEKQGSRLDAMYEYLSGEFMDVLKEEFKTETENLTRVMQRLAYQLEDLKVEALSRLGRVESRLEGVESRLVGVELEMRELKERMERLEVRMDAMHEFLRDELRVVLRKELRSVIREELNRGREDGQES